MLADMDQMKVSQQKALMHIEKHLMQMTVVASNMIQINEALENEQVIKDIGKDVMDAS